MPSESLQIEKNAEEVRWQEKLGTLPFLKFTFAGLCSFTAFLRFACETDFADFEGYAQYFEEVLLFEL